MTDRYDEKARELAVRLDTKSLAGLLEGTWAWGLGGCQARGIKTPAPVTVADGPLGVSKVTVRKDAAPASVCYPSPAAMAATWNVGLEKDVGRAMGYECRRQGVDVLLAPGLNIKKDPRCGRNFEYFSEDPLLSGTMAAALVTGLSTQGVGACLKHYCCNNQETLRLNVNAVVDPRALNDVYLKAFRIALANSTPWCVMGAYNMVNGSYACENAGLIGKLRHELGFGGVYMSDWGAVADPIRSYAAGLDVVMPGNGGDYTRQVLKACRTGRLSAALIRQRAQKVLALAFKAQAAKRIVPRGSAGDCLDTALRGACESIVLLENHGVLPLRKNIRLALVGLFADRPRFQGSGSSRLNARGVTSARQALEAAGVSFSYAPGYDEFGGDRDESLASEAERVTRQAEVAVVFLGLPRFCESETLEREDLNLPANQLALASRLEATGTPLVFVVQTGSPVALPFASRAGALLIQYLGGSQSGAAIAAVLTGRVNPSGRLPETFPVAAEAVADSDVFPSRTGILPYYESVYVGYRYCDSFAKAVAYPFGFGLSYTSFSCRKPAFATAALKPTDTLRFTCAVRNNGRLAGQQTLQIYFAPLASKDFRPVHELCAYDKKMIAPGRQKTFAFAIPVRSFAYWSGTREEVAAGDYEIQIGFSSRDIRRRFTIRVDSPFSGRDQRRVFPSYYPARVSDDHVFAPAEFVGLMGPECRKWASGLPAGPITSNTPLVRVFAATALGRKLLPFITRVARREMCRNFGERDTPAVNRLAEASFESPIRIMAAIGWSQAKTRGLVDFGRGHWLRGLLRISWGRMVTARRNNKPRK